METLDLIRQIIADKIASNHAPTHATEAEVRERCPLSASELDALERCGMIRMGRTINSRWIEIVGNS